MHSTIRNWLNILWHKWKKECAYKVLFDDMEMFVTFSRNQSKKQRIQNTGNPCYPNLIYS